MITFAERAITDPVEFDALVDELTWVALAHTSEPRGRITELSERQPFSQTQPKPHSFVHCRLGTANSLAFGRGDMLEFTISMTFPEEFNLAPGVTVEFRDGIRIAAGRLD